MALSEVFLPGSGKVVRLYLPRAMYLTKAIFLSHLSYFFNKFQYILLTLTKRDQ